MFYLTIENRLIDAPSHDDAEVIAHKYNTEVLGEFNGSLDHLINPTPLNVQ